MRHCASTGRLALYQTARRDEPSASRPPMKIAVVHTYAAASGHELTHHSKICRDRALGSLLTSEYAHDVRGFGCTLAPTPCVIDADEFLAWRYAPVDRDHTERRADDRGSLALVGDVREFNPDIVFLKGVGTRLGRTVLRVFKTPLGSILGGRFMTPDVSHAELILTETIVQERYLAERLSSVRLIRLPKLVNDTFFAAERSQFPAFDIVSVGKLSPWKNHSALLDLAQHPVSIVLVGEGPVRTDLEEKFKSARASLLVTGNVSRGEVARYLSTARLLVHPSSAEGFPRAVAEAMAIGLPVVALDGVVGPPVVDGHNGVLVDEAHLVDAIVSLLDDDRSLRRLGQNARSTAEAEFSLEALRDRLPDIEHAISEIQVRWRARGLRDRRVRLVRARVLIQCPRLVRRAVAAVRRRLRRRAPDSRFGSRRP